MVSARPDRAATTAACGSTSDGVSWNVSTPKVCSTTRPTSDESGAGQRARRALAQELLLRRDVGAVLPELDVAAGRQIAEEEASTSTSGSGGSETNSRRESSGGRRPARVTRYVSPGHAHARFGLDVEERLDARRIVEVDRAARHEIASPLEGELPAIDLGAAEQQRAIVRAAELQIGVGQQPRRRCSGPAAVDGATIRTS
jgi:hypothetical protein